MKFVKFAGAAVVALTLSLAAKADDLYANTIAKFTTSVNTSDNTQLGIGAFNQYYAPQDWYGDESYSGQTRLTTTFNYKTISFASSLFGSGGYLDITTFEPDPNYNYFVTAYAGAYDPNNRGTGWLGDAGFPGNYITNTGGDFQVVLPQGMDLTLLIVGYFGNGTNLGTPLNIQIDNYDSNGNPVDAVLPTAATPEPSSLMLVGTGLLTVVGGVRRRFKTA